MNDKLFDKCLKAITNSNRCGFGFVLDFANTILSDEYSNGTKVRHAIMMWNYILPNGNNRQVDYFSSTTLSLTGLNKDILFKSDHVVAYDDPDVSSYIGSQFIWKDRFLAIPVNSYSNNSDYLFAAGVVILIFDKNHVRVDHNKLKIIHLLLNSKEPVAFSSSNVCAFFNEFSSNDKSELSVGDRWIQTSRALRHLSLNEEGERGHFGVRYVSCWKLNDRSDFEEDSFVKQLDCCFDGEGGEYDTHETISKYDTHYLNFFRDSQERNFFTSVS